MPQYKLQSDGRYVAADGSELYHPYKRTGSGQYLDSSGTELGLGAPAANPGGKASELRRKIFEELKAKDKQAFDANEARRQEIIQGHKDRRQKVLDTYKKLSTTNLFDVNRKFDQLKAAAVARANSSGMGQSSSLTTELQGIERERARALADAQDQRLGGQLNAEDRISQDELGFTERVDDQYPNMDAYIRLAELEGSGSQEGIDPGMYLGGAGGAAPVFAGAGYGGLGIPGGGGGYGGYTPAPVRKPSGPTLGKLRNMDPATYRQLYGGVQSHGPNAVVSGGVAPVAGGVNPFYTPPGMPQVGMPTLPTARPSVIQPKLPKAKPLTYAPPTQVPRYQRGPTGKVDVPGGTYQGIWTPPIQTTPFPSGNTYDPSELPPGFWDA